jgi:glycosyltransferase involved in cell wall biosynthesis
MKIAFVIYPNAVISGASNGVRSQALTWRSIIQQAGGECVLVNHWENYDWTTFDVVHIFGHDVGTYTFVSALSQKNPRIVISPIIDSQRSYAAYRVATHNGFLRARLFSNNFALRKALDCAQGVCVRTEHEGGYLRHSFGLPPEKIFKVPLSCGMQAPEEIESLLLNKQRFCLHVSSLYQDRKNVKRLVEAAKKFGFNLVLAGSMGAEGEFSSIQNAIGGADNISVLGYVSTQELLRLYARAKVFALPSLQEGVGIVALDAALFGCNVAITNIKGPGEYWPHIRTVSRVNPRDSGEIGKKIMTLLDTPNTRELHDHVLRHYSKAAAADLLDAMYRTILKH